MGCIGDGWHKVGNCRVLVQNRVITYTQVLGQNGEWKPARIKKWNKTWHRYDCVGRVTLAALRSGLNRGTMTIS